MKPETINNKLREYFLYESNAFGMNAAWPRTDNEIAKTIFGVSKSDVYNFRRSEDILGVDERRLQAFLKQRDLAEARLRQIKSERLASAVAFVVMFIALTALAIFF